MADANDVVQAIEDLVKELVTSAIARTEPDGDMLFILKDQLKTALVKFTAGDGYTDHGYEIVEDHVVDVDGIIAADFPFIPLQHGEVGIPPGGKVTIEHGVGPTVVHSLSGEAALEAHEQHLAQGGP